MPNTHGNVSSLQSLANLGSIPTCNSDELAVVDLSDFDRPQEFSFRALNEMVNGAAALLKTQGYKAGDKVGLLGLNSASYLACFLGVLRIGGTVVPLNIKYPKEILEYVIDEAALNWLFVDKDHGQVGIKGTNPLSMDPTSLQKQSEADGFLVYEPKPIETALILFTSGSTGRPKGVVHSHGSQLAMIEPMARKIDRRLTGVVAAPLYHMNGLVYSLMLLLGEGTVILMPRFNAQTYLRALERYKVPLVTGVPTMLALMAKERALISTLDLSAVKTVRVGSAPFSETTIRETRKMFPNAVVMNGYGTTEAGGGMFGPHPDGKPLPSSSIGYPSPHVEIRLVDGIDEDQGTLEVKTPTMMSGYLNQPDLTAAVISEDGWLNTGDIMRRDVDGFFYVVGRNDDMFVCGGENIYPGQIERILEKDSRISAACVVPVPDNVRGNMPVAVITLSGDSHVTAEQAKALVFEEAPPYMHPRHVFTIDNMPLAGTNKIDRGALIEWVLVQIGRERNAIEN